MYAWFLLLLGHSNSSLTLIALTAFLIAWYTLCLSLIISNSLTFLKTPSSLAFYVFSELFAVFGIGGNRRIEKILLNGSISWSWSVSCGRPPWTDAVVILSAHHFSPSLLMFLAKFFFAWAVLSPNRNHFRLQGSSGLRQ